MDRKTNLADLSLDFETWAPAQRLFIPARPSSHSVETDSILAVPDSDSAERPSHSAQSESHSAEFELPRNQSSGSGSAGSESILADCESIPATSYLTCFKTHGRLSSSPIPANTLKTSHRPGGRE